MSTIDLKAIRERDAKYRAKVKLDWGTAEDDRSRLLALTTSTLARGCQSYGSERSRWSPPKESLPAVCWEFDVGRQRPCAVCELAQACAGGTDPKAWFDVIREAKRP